MLRFLFAVTLVVFCVLKESFARPLPALYQNVLLVRDDGTLAVQGLEIFPKIGVDEGKGQSLGTISIKSPIALEKTVIINTEAAKQALSALDPDTKKQYYLLKVKEFYDFLPLSRKEHDKYLRLEIVDRGDMGYFDKSEQDDGEDVLAEGLVKRSAEDSLSSSANSEQNLFAEQNVNNENKGDLKMSVKREVSDDTLMQNINVFQTHYVGKRDVLDSPMAQLYERNLVSDLGNFYSNSESLTSDPDDPQNNNFRHVAYVPFFRVRKYYIERNRLDVGL